MEKYLCYGLAASAGALLVWVLHAGMLEIIIVTAVLIAVVPIIKKAQADRRSKAANQNC